MFLPWNAELVRGGQLHVLKTSQIEQIRRITFQSNFLKLAKEKHWDKHRILKRFVALKLSDRIDHSKHQNAQP